MPRSPSPALLRAVIVGAMLLAGCAGATSEDASQRADVPTSEASSPAAAGDPIERLSERVEVVAGHVADWSEAADLAAARSAAEAAANIIAGPEGPGSGDRDGDGETRGPSDAGILPGADGTPEGFALEAVAAGAPECVTADVLGGSWDDPSAKWGELDDVLSRWTESNNTMPELASHAQRVIGWARLTMDTDDVAEARTFAGHAGIHVRVMRDALATCR